MGAVVWQRLLLDSHILLWWEHSPQRLSQAQLSAIKHAENEVFVSAVTTWELGIKRAKGKLSYEGSIEDRVGRFGFSELSISSLHAARAAELPALHGDLFDRMLVAQAMLEGLTLVTVDPMMARYGATVLV